MSDREPGLSPIVKDITRVVAAFIMLFGFNIVFFGHLTPGGGFAGGVILAAGIILVVLAFGRQYGQRFNFTERMATFWDSMGALLFLLVALGGYTVGTFFLMSFIRLPEQKFTLLSAPAILICNIAIAAKVGAALFGVFIAMAIWRLARHQGKDLS